MSPIITLKSFPDPPYVEDFVIRGGYFGSTLESGVVWPAEISGTVSGSPLAMSAVGAMFFYFDEVFIIPLFMFHTSLVGYQRPDIHFRFAVEIRWRGAPEGQLLHVPCFMGRQVLATGLHGSY
jgi:hypothetical protein